MKELHKGADEFQFSSYWCDESLMFPYDLGVPGVADRLWPFLSKTRQVVNETRENKGSAPFYE